jgi:hypothetical protein
MTFQANETLSVCFFRILPKKCIHLEKRISCSIKNLNVENYYCFRVIPSNPRILPISKLRYRPIPSVQKKTSCSRTVCFFCQNIYLNTLES